MDDVAASGVDEGFIDTLLYVARVPVFGRRYVKVKLVITHGVILVWAHNEMLCVHGKKSPIRGMHVSGR